MNSLRAIRLPLLVLFATLAGCGGREAPPTVGMANLASVNCERQGGETEIRTAPDGGQYGVCRLPDGKVCETWSLLRDGECKSCEQLGGKWEGLADPPGGIVKKGMCHLPDGKVCNEYTLLRDGSCKGEGGAGADLPTRAVHQRAGRL